MSGKDRIKAFLLANIGVVVSSKQLYEASGGIGSYARRVREIREVDGWRILSHHDRADLRPDQYLLADPPPDISPVIFERGISAKLRAEVLDRNGFTCQMCGLSPGDIDPLTGRKVRLHIGHIVDRNLGGNIQLTNLRALCSSCNQGAKNITSQKPSTIWLLSQIRRAGLAEQKAVYRWLKEKFGN